MKLLHAPAGPRTFDFLRITTDTDVVGWSEFNEAFAGPGVSVAIEQMMAQVVGRDPRRYAAILAPLRLLARQHGGPVAAAVGAIENALLDVAARSQGVPVHELLGGAVRTRMATYWSHVCTYRALWPDALGLVPIHTREDIVSAGSEVARRGFKALKTNLVLLQQGGARATSYGPGFARSGRGFPELDTPPAILDALQLQLDALREGAGPDIALMLDINHNYRAGAALAIARACEDRGLAWLELDTRSIAALVDVRSKSSVPIVSGEWMFTSQQALPLLTEAAVDVLMVDPMAAGVLEASRIAAMAAAFDRNVTLHNYYGHLATFMAMNLAAVVPNVTSVEADWEHAPACTSFYSSAPRLKDGELLLPQGSGWGVDVDERALVAASAGTA